jgi:hypothetical protein
MRGPDAVFGLIKFYLAQFTITKTDKILFVSDGARWIWNRVPELMKSLGLAATQFYSDVITSIRSICRGRKSKKLKTEKNILSAIADECSIHSLHH